MNLSDIASQMTFSRTIVLTLQEFYKKTNISGNIVFNYNPNINQMEIGLGFAPREPNEDEYSILFELFANFEKLLMNDYVLAASKEVENLNQLVFKHQESTRRIVERNKN